MPLAIAALTAAGGAAYYFVSLSKSEPEVSQPVKSSEQSLVTKNDDRFEPELSQPKKSSELTLIANKDAESSGNKVRDVQISPGMKNTEGKSPSIMIHPEGGNRVNVRLEKAKEPTDVRDSKMTDQAIAKLGGSRTEEAATSLVESHQSAWSSMDATYFHDLESLTVSQLKARVVQLAAEIKDQARWEAVRLKEFLTMKEKEIEAKYVQMLLPIFSVATSPTHSVSFVCYFAGTWKLCKNKGSSWKIGWRKNFEKRILRRPTAFAKRC